MISDLAVSGPIVVAPSSGESVPDQQSAYVLNNIVSHFESKSAKRGTVFATCWSGPPGSRGFCQNYLSFNIFPGSSRILVKDIQDKLKDL